MKTIYYNIWSDAIKAALQKNNENENEWKIILLLIFSVAQSFNVLTLFMGLSTLNFKVNIFINFDFLPNTMLDSFLSSLITLFLPFIILNYFLIFYRRRYQIIIKESSNKNTKGRKFMLYFVLSMLIFILPIIIGKWIFPLFG